MKKISILLFAALLFSSCSTMYVKPSIQPVIFTQKIPLAASLAFSSAAKVLPALGYKIGGMDSAGKTITTKPSEVTIKPEDCDCGEILGIPVVKSGGIKASVYFILQVSGDELSLKADITPEMTGALSTLTAAGFTAACVSKGGLEKVLAKQLLQKMGTKLLQLPFGQ